MRGGQWTLTIGYAATAKQSSGGASSANVNLVQHGRYHRPYDGTARKHKSKARAEMARGKRVCCHKARI